MADEQNNLNRFFKFLKKIKNNKKDNYFTNTVGNPIAPLWRSIRYYIKEHSLDQNVELIYSNAENIIAGKQGEVLDEINKAIKIINENKNLRSDIIRDHDIDLAQFPLTEPDTKLDEYRIRFNSFFNMVKGQLHDNNNGFFLCQEDNYVTLYDMIFEEDVKTVVKPVLGTQIKTGINFIHATKVGKNNSQATSVGFLPSTIQSKESIQSKLKTNPAELGDGVTIYYGKNWKCIKWWYSSGNNNNNGLFSSGVESVGAPTFINHPDPCVIGIFQYVPDSTTKIIVATTHLASGDHYNKENELDIQRVTSITNLLKQVDDNNTENLPVILGMDGNSSAFYKDTGVIQTLLEEKYQTMIEKHDPQYPNGTSEDSTGDIPDGGNQVTLPLSSIKQRGFATDQPWKMEPIGALIDYLMIKHLDNQIKITTSAKLPLILLPDPNVIKEYALPNSLTEYTIPKLDDRDKIENWTYWASDHLPVCAELDWGDIKIPVTTCNALAMGLVKDGFKLGLHWDKLKPGENSSPVVTITDGGKRTRNRRKHKTRRRRKRTRRGRK